MLKIQMIIMCLLLVSCNAIEETEATGPAEKVEVKAKAEVVVAQAEGRDEAPLRLSPKVTADQMKALGDVVKVSNTKNMRKYFAHQVNRLGGQLTKYKTLEAWEKQRPVLKKQFMEMLNLDPLPEKTDLGITFTGTVEHKDFAVHKVYFESMPGLYVTGNLYMPRNLKKKAPAVLYVCGHGKVKIDGVSYGNKVYYQHHGTWFARNGYVCLIIDSLQLGEIEGLHHGTYRHGMWWWHNRGYTPASIEAWNCIRALDVLESVEDVDRERIGVTGRSGGGAYSWYAAALDERVKAAIPVAGITDLEDHVVGDVIEGHCDCMFFNNTYEWDYPMMAALVAPRALLISNTDKDSIFPLVGVQRTHAQVKHIYELYGKANQLGLHIVDGPHKDTQKLRIHAFSWLNRFLKGDTESVITDTGEKPFKPEELKVFKALPDDEINTKIHESFVKVNQAKVPENFESWEIEKQRLNHYLDVQVFRSWVGNAESPKVKQVHEQLLGDAKAIYYEVETQPGVVLQLVEVRPNVLRTNPTNEKYPATLRFTDQEKVAGQAKLGVEGKNVTYLMLPRGDGLTKWVAKRKGREQDLLRRYALLGQTEDGMAALDVLQMLKAIEIVNGKVTPLAIHAADKNAVIALVAARIRNPQIDRLVLKGVPSTLRQGPYFLNIDREIDVPQLVALTASHTQVYLDGFHTEAKSWDYVLQVKLVHSKANKTFGLLVLSEK